MAALTLIATVAAVLYVWCGLVDHLADMLSRRVPRGRR